MKKSLLLIVALLIGMISFAQGLNYKALITENGTALNTQNVDFKFTIFQNGTTAVYEENQSATTDTNGIVSLNIGEGTAVSGNFDTIDWSAGSYFLKVEIDTGNGMQDFGTTELKYVPFAKYAETAGNTFSGDFNDLTNLPAGLSDGDDVNDADHNPTNEIQSLSFDNGSRQLTISNGNTVTIPAGSASGGDGWGTQVAATDSSINGDGTSANPLGVNPNASIFNGWDKNASDDFSGNFNDLSNIPAGLSDGDDVNDADHDATNELQTISKSGSTVTLSNGGGSFTDAVNDADHDPSNELQTISKSGSTVTLSNGGGSFTDAVNDADHSPTNEIQTLSVNGTQLTISNGNTVTLPTGSGGDQWGSQVVQSDASLNGDGTSANPLGVNPNASIFNGWDKNASDDFSGDFNDLSNIPANLDTDSTDDVQALNDLSDAKVVMDTYMENSSYYIGEGAGIADPGNGYGSNTGVGFYALSSNTDGYANTATGSYALNDNTTGGGNTATGSYALYDNTTGSGNTATGSYALDNNTIGGYNTATGSNALNYNTNGDYNTATGSYALGNNTTGGENTALGAFVLWGNDTGDNNTALGASAGYSSTGSGNIFIGYKAGFNETGDNKLYIENSNSSTPLIYGDFATDELQINGSLAVKDGSQGAGKIFTSDGNGKGTWQDVSAWDTDASDDVQALNDLSDAKRVYESFYGEYSYYLGEGAGNADDGSISWRNTGVGYNALNANSNGNSDTAIGSLALSNNTNGVLNTAIGAEALKSNSTGDSNTATGSLALSNNTTGRDNTATGSLALSNNTTGNSNTALGTQAGYDATGSNNIFIGYQAGYNETGDNKLYIDNSNTAAPLIYGDFNEDYITINGELRKPDSGDADMTAYVYGLVFYNGNIAGNQSSSGFTVTKIGAGQYKIHLNNMSNQNYVVMVTSEIGGGGVPVFATTDYSNTDGEFIVRIYNLSGSTVDNSFHFVVYKK